MTTVPSQVSYVSGTSDKPLLGDTIADDFDRTVAAHGDRDALVDRATGRRWTYRELADEVNAVALGLVDLGVEKGDRVGIWSPNCAEWTFTQYATAKIGAILVNINPAYRTHELKYVLNQAGIRTLVAARSFKTSDYAAMIDEARPECPNLQDVLLIGGEAWTDLVAAGRGGSAAHLAELQANLTADDPINIQYTSGTTGFPKGATLSHHNILNNGYFVGELCNYTEADRVCIPVPFYHCFGMVMGNLACTSHGACMVIPAPAFDPKATLEAVAEEKCTSLYGVPMMFIAELEHPRFSEFDLSSLRTGVMAGAPCPVEVMKLVRTKMHMREVTIVCGMTETSPISTQTAVDDPPAKQVETVGRVHPHVEVKIVDPESGVILPRGTPGEQCTRGYNVMLGYWNDEAGTRKAIDEAGWMHSGDLATMDEEGYVRIVGRLKDMVVRGGENVYPREIEEFLYTIPEICDAQVIGVPSEKYGEEVMAWVKLRAGVSMSEERLRGLCEGRISTFKIPRYWKFVDAFPMTVTGKIQKFRMREIAVEELGLGPVRP
jgi:fatty-acyl-CoA synthase